MIERDEEHHAMGGKEETGGNAHVVGIGVCRLEQQVLIRVSMQGKFASGSFADLRVF